MKSFKRGEPIKVLRFERRGEQASLFQSVEPANFIEMKDKTHCMIVNATGRIETIDIANIVIDENYGGANEDKPLA